MDADWIFLSVSKFVICCIMLLGLWSELMWGRAEESLINLRGPSNHESRGTKVQVHNQSFKCFSVISAVGPTELNWIIFFLFSTLSVCLYINILFNYFFNPVPIISVSTIVHASTESLWALFHPTIERLWNGVIRVPNCISICERFGSVWRGTA